MCQVSSCLPNDEITTVYCLIFAPSYHNIIIVVEVEYRITASHKGYVQFKLCENDVVQSGNDASVRVTQACLDQNILKTPSGLDR